MVDIVSKNGNLLLNIGPRADGTIPDEVQKVLLNVGAWLNVNGEAIYGTRHLRVNGEGPAWPANGEAVIHSLVPSAGSERVRSLELVGSDAKSILTNEMTGCTCVCRASLPQNTRTCFV